MDCRRFEDCLEALSCGRLSANERRACETHAAGCEQCGELLVLATLPVEAEPDTSGFVAAVLARTTAGLCEGTSSRLPDLVDGSLPAGEHSLVAGHVADCAECSGLVSALTLLARELPQLAQVRPDERFVDDVLRRTLPVHVQLRRWWSRVWPRWLHRPRFASEAAYVALLVCVLVFATPGSPLEAVPQRALAVARQPVASEALISEGLKDRFASVRARVENSSVRTVDRWFAIASRSADRAQVLLDKTGHGLATLRREAASLLGQDGEDAASQSTDSTKESP